MGDVGERACMDERSLALEGLHDGGMQGILEEHRHGAGNPEVFERDLFALGGRADDHTPAALAQITKCGRVVGAIYEGENRHQLAGDGDIEAGLAWDAVRGSAEADNGVAQARSLTSTTLRQATRLGSIPRRSRPKAASSSSVRRLS